MFRNELGPSSPSQKKRYHFSDRDGVSLITEDYHNIGVPTPDDSNRDGDFRAH
jgi:hypothetical protein